MPDRPIVPGAQATRSGSPPAEQADPWPADDPLGEALHFLRMSGAFYGRSELTEPWGLTVPPLAGHLWFHVVLTGECRLETAGAEPVLLQPGDFSLVPRGEGHRLRSGPNVPAPSILELERELVSPRYEILRHGGGAAPATMICGAVRFDHPAAPDLIRLLPRVLHLPSAALARSDGLASLLALMAAEAGSRRAGGEAVITRLADVVVILAIRTWIESDPDAQTGWLGALRDPQIGRALTLIHRQPEQEWTVALLARKVAMSRSAFASRFAQLVGEPVMHYVARWRMQLAATELREDGVSVGRLADRLGYRSEAAFRRAFKRVVGVAPGSLRRRSPAGESTARLA